MVYKKLAIGQTVKDNYPWQCVVRDRSGVLNVASEAKLAQITTQFNDGASRTVSKRTVQRSLHRVSFGSRPPTRVPLLNACHRTPRLALAREHRYWSEEDWKRVAWSNESRS
ncbi:HTH_Tnp_Tc3_2 domain-containing protein [Trichonephila clavipes]|nr:HTH_Tnp_Tc3_2 domain-containing protein [Trichonephila clavipes]